MNRPRYYLSVHEDRRPCGTFKSAIVDLKTDLGAIRRAEIMANRERQDVHIWWLPDVYCLDTDPHIRKVAVVSPEASP